MNNVKKGIKLRVTGSGFRVKSFELRVFLPGTRNPEPVTVSFSPTQLLIIACRSVKTRRKSFGSNDVFLQTGKTGVITAEAQRLAEKKDKNHIFIKGKTINVKSGCATAEKKGKKRIFVREKTKQENLMMILPNRVKVA